MPTVLSRKSGGGGSGGGVTSLDGLSGAVTLSEGSGITLTPTGNDIEIAATGGGGLFSAYAVLQHQETDGTEGGTFTQDDWRTRPLTTELFDPDAIVSLAANQFTLAAGTYFIQAWAAGYAVAINKLRIRNITAGSDAIIGVNQRCDGTAAMAVLSGRVTIAGSTAFELQHRCSTSKATNGFGVACSFGVIEVYAQVSIYREA